jgi:hypothetical protein
MDRMDISLLLLKLKTGDPAMINKFIEKITGLIEKQELVEFRNVLEIVIHFFYHDRASPYDLSLLT